MYEGKGKPTWLFYIAVSLVVALWVGVCDAVGLWVNGILSFEELFLVGTGEFNVSVIGYTILFALGVCLLLSVLGYVVLRPFPVHLEKRSGISHVVVCGLLSALVLLGLRFRYMEREPESGKHLAVFLAVSLVSLVALGIALTRFEKRVKFSAFLGRYAVALLFLGGLLFVFFLPQLQSLFLQSRSQGAGGIEQGRPNVILIVMDTTRADALSCYNPGKKTTPNIDKIAAEGTRFARAISAAQWTAPSHASMFTGLYPSQHRTCWEYALLDEEYMTLAECLSGSGYRTVGFSENPFVSRRRGMTQGFGTFYEMHRYRLLSVLSRLIDKGRKILSDFMPTAEFAGETSRFFKNWVLKNAAGREGQPFFAFLNFMPGHLPNYRREEFEFVRPDKKVMARIEPINAYPERYYLPQYKLTAGELRTMRLLYDGDIAYMDSVFGEMFAFLRESGLLDNTVLIITSDHGENFGDHGFIEHFFSLHNSLLHVPLIIRFPRKFEPGTVREDVVSTAFLFRTILDLTGEPRKEPPYPVESRSLIDSGRGGLICSEHDNGLKLIRGVVEDEAPKDFDFTPFDKYMKCIYHDGVKFIWSSLEKHELYDMAGDWAELDNLCGQDRESAAAYQELLKNWHQSLWMPSFARQKKLDDKSEEALKALGYIK